MAATLVAAFAGAAEVAVFAAVDLTATFFAAAFFAAGVFAAIFLAAAALVDLIAASFLIAALDGKASATPVLAALERLSVIGTGLAGPLSI